MQTLEALGTTVELRLVVHDVAHAERWFATLWDDVRAFETRFSRFRHDSELTLFNQHAGERVATSSEFSRLLATARDLSIRTNGLFNPFILPRLQQAGYRSSMTEPHPDTPDYSTRRVGDMTELELGDSWARIPADTALDLGGIGKGYLADQLTDRIGQDDQAEGCCISLGGDIRVNGIDATGQPWRIDVQSGEDRTQDVAVFTSTSTVPAVATSGLVREKGGVQQVHQVSTGDLGVSAVPYTVCTVACADATTADVLASSVLMGGEVFANRMLSQGVIAGALLQRTGAVPILLGTGISLV